MNILLAVLLIYFGASSEGEERISSVAMQKKGVQSYLLRSVSPQYADLDLLDSSKSRILSLKVDVVGPSILMNIARKEGETDIKVRWDSAEGILAIASGEENAVLTFDLESKVWKSDGSLVLLEQVEEIVKVAAGAVADLISHGALREPNKSAPLPSDDSSPEPSGSNKVPN